MRHLCWLYLFLLLGGTAWGQGVTWGSRVRVDNAPGVAGHPAIHPYTIIDDSLNIYTVWEDDRDNNGRHAIRFGRSTNLAASFSDTVVCSDAAYDNVYPWMAKGKSGRIYLVWQAKYPDTFWRICFSASADNGLTFSAPDTVKGVRIRNNKDDANNYGPLPRIAVDPKDSVLYLVWTEAYGTSSTKIRSAYSLAHNEVFAGLTRVNVDSTKAAKHPAITTDDSGKVFVVYEQSNSGSTNDPQCDVFFNRSSDFGASFSGTDLKINDNIDVARMQNPTIARIGGRTMTIWEDTRSGAAASNAQPCLFFSQKADTAAAFSVNARVDHGAGTWNYRPRMAMDRVTGSMVVVWNSNIGLTDSLFELRLCAYNDTIGQFTQSYRLFNTYTGKSGANFGNSFYPPALAIKAIDTMANFFLVWRDLTEDSTGNLYAIRGRVLPGQIDLDIFPDRLDARGDSVFFGSLPALSTQATRQILIVNTTDTLNPDPLDGPSNRAIAGIAANPVLLRDPATGNTIAGAVAVTSPQPLVGLAIGQKDTLTLSLTLTAAAKAGLYRGYFRLNATGVDSSLDADSIKLVVRVLKTDLDIFAEALDARGDSLDFGRLPAGPAYVSRMFRCANTSAQLNPDVSDGPSDCDFAWLASDSVVLVNAAAASQRVLTAFVERPLPLPALRMGQTADVTVTLYVPQGTITGRYDGYLRLRAAGTDSTRDADSIRVVVSGPYAKGTLDSLVVFPNPFKPWLGHTEVNFEGLTDRATIKLFDIKGRLVKQIDEADGDGLATWQPSAASGIYLWSVTTPQGLKCTGKLAIIR